MNQPNCFLSSFNKYCDFQHFTVNISACLVGVVYRISVLIAPAVMGIIPLWAISKSASLFSIGIQPTFTLVREPNARFHQHVQHVRASLSDPESFTLTLVLCIYHCIRYACSFLRSQLKRITECRWKLFNADDIGYPGQLLGWPYQELGIQSAILSGRSIIE